MPARMETRLTYQKTVAVANAGFTYANVRFTPTSAYDVDPTLGSTAMPGFSELSGIYRFYRVRSFVCRARFSNLDSATTGTVYICPTNIDPGANASPNQPYISNRRARTDIIGPLNGNGVSKALVVKAGPDTYGGVVWTGQLDSYCAGVASTPTNNIYVAAGFQANTAMTSGVNLDISITIRLEFFELSSPVA